MRESTETVKRSDLAGHAGYGYCVSHSRFFWGFRLYLLCTRTGCPRSGGSRTPRSGNARSPRISSVTTRHQIHSRQVTIGDKGFVSRDFEAFVRDELGSHLIRPDRKDEKKRFGKLGGIRQWVESIFNALKGQLTLEDHGGRTPQASSPALPPDSSPSPPESGTTGSLTPRETLPHRLRPLNPIELIHLG